MVIRTKRHDIIHSEDPAALADAVDAAQRSARAIFNNTTAHIHRTGQLPKKFDLYNMVTAWRREGEVGQATVSVQRGAALQALFSCANHFAHVRKVSDRLLWDMAAEKIAVAWLATLPEGCEAPEGRKALKEWLETLSKGEAPTQKQRSALLHKSLKRFRPPRDAKDFMRSRNRYDSGRDRPALFFVGGVRRLEARLLHIPGFGAMIIKGDIDPDADIVSAHLVERTKHPRGRKGQKCPQSDRRFAVHLQIRTPAPPPKPIVPETALGVDVGIVNAASTSDGRLFRFPDESDLQDRIVASQQRRAKLTRYSVAWRRELKKEQRLRRKIKHRRLNAIRHLALFLAQNSSLLAVEDFQAQNLLRSAQGTVSAPGRNVKAKRTLNRKLARASLGMLLQAMAAACEKAGATLCAVPAQHTSQTCSLCGHVDKRNRKTQSVFLCRNCHHLAHADINAALVILERALVQLGLIVQTGGRDGLPVPQPTGCGRETSRAERPDGSAVEVQVERLVRLWTESAGFEQANRQKFGGGPERTGVCKSLMPLG